MRSQYSACELIERAITRLASRRSSCSASVIFTMPILLSRFKIYESYMIRIFLKMRTRSCRWYQQNLAGYFRPSSMAKKNQIRDLAVLAGGLLRYNRAILYSAMQFTAEGCHLNVLLRYRRAYILISVPIPSP